MKWFKHMTGSHEDPDISDAWDYFGDSAIVTFWTILEVYGREFNSIEDNGFLTLSIKFWERKLRRKLNKFEKILEFFQKRQRIFYKITENSLSISVPLFLKLSSNWTRRKKSKTMEAPSEEPTKATTAIEEEKEVEEKKNKYTSDSDEYRLSEFLFNLIRERNPEHKKPNFQNWAKHINYLLWIDGRDPTEVEKVIQWCQADPFWQNNILSTEKLRKQYDQLKLKMKSIEKNNNNEPNYRSLN